MAGIALRSRARAQGNHAFPGPEGFIWGRGFTCLKTLEVAFILNRNRMKLRTRHTRSADRFSGSNYRRARVRRENRAHTQSALLWRRGPEASGRPWHEAALATGWPGRRAQAPPRRSPQRQLSSGEQGETSTRSRSTKFQLHKNNTPCPDRSSNGDTAQEK
jgi:hypothetical protein